MRTVARFVLALILLSLAPLAALAKAEPVGELWRVMLTSGDQEYEQTIRIYQDEVYKGADRIGTVQRHGDNEMTIRIERFTSLNGQFDLRRVKGGQHGGEFHKADGTVWKVKTRVIDHEGLPAKDHESVKGAIWLITLTRGDEEVEHRVRVRYEELYNFDDKIGTIQRKGDEAIFRITNAPSLNGRIVLHGMTEDIGTGTFYKADGTQWKVKALRINQ